MCWIMVDTEADGPVPVDYSMISIGAVIVEPGLSRQFYATLKPVSDKWDPDALALSGFTREDTLEFEDPAIVMSRFSRWLETVGGKNLFFISDNNGFDWQFVNWYFHHFTNGNPFGFGSSNLLSIYNGIMKDMYLQLKKTHRKSHKVHNALEHAVKNAELLIKLKEKFGLKINW
jgi:hypothetical protein